MDDLKTLVIQSLEDEGTLSALRAQLRSRVFHAIERNAESQSKQELGFQWQNPTAQRIHENEDAKLIALLIKEYLEYYRMEYTLSTYLPEVSLQQEQAQSREELQKKAGLGEGGQEPLLVLLLKNLKKQSSPQQKDGKDDIVEEIEAQEDLDPKEEKDPVVTSGSIVDQSIDTHRLEEYDYMEEINQ